MTAVHPGAQRQKDVMHIIYDEIKAGEREASICLNRVVDELTREKGCESGHSGMYGAVGYINIFMKSPDCCLDAMDSADREAILRLRSGLSVIGEDKIIK